MLQDFRSAPEADVSNHRGIGRNGPCVDGSELARRIFTSQAWSVQPCVRPLSAVHMTAGHNALRRSSPGHKLAFENAMAHGIGWRWRGAINRAVQSQPFRASAVGERRAPVRIDPVSRIDELVAPRLYWIAGTAFRLTRCCKCAGAAKRTLPSTTQSRVAI